MNPIVWGIFIGAGLCAIGDWISVARSSKAEYLFKPATMIFLIGAALAFDPQDIFRRNWFVIALCFGLAGDVLLMLPRDAFILGLSAFLAGHVSYITGFLSSGLDLMITAIALVAFGIVAIGVGRELIKRIGRIGSLRIPVGLYIAVITLMSSTAAGSLNLIALMGDLLFMVSDGVLAWNRFAGRIPGGRLAVIITYHGAQGLLVLSLM